VRDSHGRILGGAVQLPLAAMSLAFVVRAKRRVQPRG